MYVGGVPQAYISTVQVPTYLHKYVHMVEIEHTYVQCIYEQYMYVLIYIRMYVCTYGRN